MLFRSIKDAVHPGPVGQTVMAASIIADMVKKTQVSQIVIEATPGAPKSIGASAKVDGLTLADGKLTFTALENALPWVLPPDAAEGYALSKAGHRFSMEKVTVRNLKPGKYEMKIDGQAVGQWMDGQLALGVELEEIGRAHV